MEYNLKYFMYDVIKIQFDKKKKKIYRPLKYFKFINSKSVS